MKFKFSIKEINAQSGQVLVNVMIAGAMIAGILVAVMSITSEQSKSLKHLFQKSEILELKNNMTNALAKPAVCSWQFFGQTIDTTNPASVPTTLALNVLYSGLTPSTPILVKKLEKALSYLKVKDIKYVKIHQTVGDEYTGTLQVFFDQSADMQPFKQLELTLNVVIDSSLGTVGARPIKNCYAPNTGAGFYTPPEGSVLATLTCGPSTSLTCTYPFSSYPDFTHISMNGNCYVMSQSSLSKIEFSILDSTNAVLWTSQLCSIYGVTNSQTGMTGSSIVLPRPSNGSKLKIEINSPTSGSSFSTIYFWK